MDMKISVATRPAAAYLDKPLPGEGAVAQDPVSATAQAQAPAQQPVSPPGSAELTKAVENINKSMQSQGLEFSVDDEDRTIVKVVDRETGDLIRQMPSKEALEIAHALQRAQGLLISQKA